MTLNEKRIIFLIGINVLIILGLYFSEIYNCKTLCEVNNMHLTDWDMFSNQVECDYKIFCIGVNYDHDRWGRTSGAYKFLYQDNNTTNRCNYW